MAPRDPAILAAQDFARTHAERLRALTRDADLATLGEPPAGVAALAPAAVSPAARQALAEYVLGALHRAGLSEAFRALVVHDALQNGDQALAALLGCQLVTEPVPGEPPRQRWTMPAGVPPVRDPEPVARDLAARLLARETARIKRRPA